MANAYTQDIVLDANGKPVFDALASVQSVVARIQREVAGIGVTTEKDAKKWASNLALNLKMLKQAQSDLNLLQQPQKMRAAGFDAVVKSARQRYKEESRAERIARSESLAMAKAFYGYELAERSKKVKAEMAMETELSTFRLKSQRDTANQDLANDRMRIASAREVRKAKLEAAQAGVIGMSRRVTNIDDAIAIKAASDARLVQLRAERREVAANDSAAARGIAERIELEKRLGASLDSVIGKLQREKLATETRFTGLSDRAQKLLVPQNVATVVNQSGSAAAALEIMRAQQVVAREGLRTALSANTVDNQVVATKIKQLELANLNVAATRRLVTEEERLAAAASRKLAADARANQPQAAPASPLSNILSARYGVTAFARTAVYGAAAAAAYGLFGALRDGLKYVIQMEDELAKLSAIANATPTQMESLGNSIREVAASSRFATVDLVKISQTLAQAGISTTQMKDVLQSVTTLANASGSTPDEAVNLVTSALGSFQLQASEASRVADLMTTALNRTKLTVQQTGQAIQYVGATAFEQNISLEQLLATVGSVAQAGVKSGSTIGTGFRQFLVDLQSPSKKLTEQLDLLGIKSSDVDVAVRGLPAVLDTLKTAGFGAGQAYEGLETRAAAFYLTAKNNTDVSDNLLLSFGQQGAAAMANERAMGSLTAKWQQFRNIVDDGFAEGLQPAVDLMKNALSGIIQLMEKAREAEDKVAKARIENSEDWFSNLRISNESVRDFLNMVDGADNAAARGWALGDGLYNLGRSATGLTAEMSQLQTQVNESSEAVETQRGKMSELDKEIGRLIVQKESLRANDLRSQGEIVTLTSRFEGLASYLRNTGNAYDDLTQAVQRFRAAQDMILFGQLDTQRAALQNQNLAAEATMRKSVAAIKGSSSRGLLTKAEMAAVDGAGGAARGSILSDAAARIAAKDPTMARALNDMAMSLGQVAVNTSSLRGIKMSQADLQSERSVGQNMPKWRSEIDADITRLGSLTGAELTTLGNATLASLDRIVGAIDKTLAKGGNFAEDVEYLERQRAGFQSQRQQVSSLIKPKASETKAAEAAAAKAARDANKAEREEQKGPPVTRGDLIRIVGQGFQLKPGSGYRSQSEQDGLYNAGKTKAKVSDHTTGLGQDFPTGNISTAAGNSMAAAIKKRLADNGIDAFVQFESGEGSRNGTGKHIHVGIRKGTRTRGTGREQQTQQSYQSDLAKAQLELDESDLSQRLKDLAVATSAETFSAAVSAAEAALAKVNADVLVVAQQDLATKGLGPGDLEYQAKMKQVQQTILQNSEKFQLSIADGLVKNMEAAFAAATEAAEAALAPSVMLQNLAEARVSGLGYASNAGKIPDYVATLAQRRASQAAESTDRARSTILPTQIAEAEAGLARGLTEINGLEKGSAAYEKASQAVVKLTNDLQKLRDEKISLDVALGAASQVPLTLADGLRVAIDAYKETHELNRTFTQDIVFNMGGAIEQAHTSITTFFTDIFTGSKGVLSAFGDMVVGMAKYLQQMAAQFVANKIFGLILNLVGSAVAPSGLAGRGDAGSLGTIATASFSPFTGGKLNAESRYAAPIARFNGGRVMNGSPMRDSVSATLAKDEWVINKAAVDSVGDEFMNDLNQRGAAALRGLGDNTIIAPSAPSQTNVWVVAPQRQPVMGPNDVLVTMHDDMLNGEGRRLIHSIASHG